MKIYWSNGRCNISGEVIRAEREAMGLSQEQFAAKVQLIGLNLTQKAISRIETGGRIVADYELIKLAEALDVTVYHLLGLKE
jgi:transcriptional regulator with XRE-family HTH domain